MGVLLWAKYPCSVGATARLHCSIGAGSSYPSWPKASYGLESILQVLAVLKVCLWREDAFVRAKIYWQPHSWQG